MLNKLQRADELSSGGGGGGGGGRGGEAAAEGRGGDSYLSAIAALMSVVLFVHWGKRWHGCDRLYIGGRGGTDVIDCTLGEEVARM